MGQEEAIGVHVTHCCFFHGCKYGVQGCPVAQGTHKQEHPCERCERPEEVQQRIDDLTKELNWALEIYKGRDPEPWEV